MRRTWLVMLLALAVVSAACASGPSSDNLRPPTTTSTTEAPPEGVYVIIIQNGAFRPSIVEIDPAVNPVIEWRHQDQDRFEYVIRSDSGVFESEPLGAGDTFQFDFSTVPPGIYRYTAELGLNRIPGSIDTRPEQ